MNRVKALSYEVVLKYRKGIPLDKTYSHLGEDAVLGTKRGGWKAQMKMVTNDGRKDEKKKSVSLQKEW